MRVFKTWDFKEIGQFVVYLHRSEPKPYIHIFNKKVVGGH